MKTWVRKTINVGVLAASAVLLTAGAAQATSQSALSNSGVLSGNGGVAAGQVVANACGNGAGVAGFGAGVSDTCTAWGKQAVTPITQTTDSNSGVGSGNLLAVVGQVVGNACGNGAGVLGGGVGVSDTCDATGDQSDSGMPTLKAKKAHKESARAEAAQTSNMNSGVLTGNNIYVPINVVANACGNGVGVLGGGLGVSDVCDAVADQGGAGNGYAMKKHSKEALPVVGELPAGADALSRIPVLGDLTGGMAQINSGKNGVSAAGIDATEKKAKKGAHKGAFARQGGGVSQMSHANSGILTGNNVAIPVQLVGNISGNGVGVLGGGVGVSDTSTAMGHQL